MTSHNGKFVCIQNICLASWIKYLVEICLIYTIFNDFPKQANYFLFFIHTYIITKTTFYSMEFSGYHLPTPSWTCVHLELLVRIIRPVWLMIQCLFHCCYVIFMFKYKVRLDKSFFIVISFHIDEMKNKYRCWWEFPSQVIEHNLVNLNEIQYILLRIQCSSKHLTPKTKTLLKSTDIWKRQSK